MKDLQTYTIAAVLLGATSLSALAAEPYVPRDHPGATATLQPLIRELFPRPRLDGGTNPEKPLQPEEGVRKPFDNPLDSPKINPDADPEDAPVQSPVAPPEDDDEGTETVASADIDKVNPAISALGDVGLAAWVYTANPEPVGVENSAVALVGDISIGSRIETFGAEGVEAVNPAAMALGQLGIGSLVELTQPTGTGVYNPASAKVGKLGHIPFV